MPKYLGIAVLLAATVAMPASADNFLFDFSGTVLAETRPNLTVTPQPITGTLRYEAPAGGNITTLMGEASLFTSLYGSFQFMSYSASRSDMLFTFSGTDMGGQRFSLRASALPGGGFGYVASDDGFSLTGTPVNASGRLDGTFADAPAIGVPEPAAWLLMVSGFGTLGAALRRRRQRMPARRVAARA